MPNVGKPSKGCKNCRDRKVKCDQKRPSCTQCVRVQQKCHGYRDPVSMMFKNEYEVVVTKAHKRYEKLSKKKQQESADGNRSNSTDSDTIDSQGVSTSVLQSLAKGSSLVGSWGPASPDSLAWEMTPCIEDQAVGFFFANYVIAPSIVPRGQFEFLRDLLNRPDTEKILQISVNAVGLAALANSTKSAYIMKKARQEYGAALSMTNNALQSPATAVKDSTLISVILLGLYENFNYEDMKSVQAWAKHVNGACTLITLRGEDQLKRNLGMKLFKQFYGTILLKALQTSTPAPESVVKLWELSTELADELGYYDLQGRQWTIRLIKYMHECVKLTQETADPLTMVIKALKLEQELHSMHAIQPTIWRYETVYVQGYQKYLFGNYYHIYTNAWVAQVWNYTRVCSTILQHIILGQLKKGTTESPPRFTPKHIQRQKEASIRKIRSNLAGICATTPQYTGQLPFPDLPDTAPADLVTLDLQDPRYQLHPPGTFLSTRPTGLHNIILPLYSAGQTDISPPRLRQWVIDRLFFVALKMGTKEAVVMAEQLKQKQRDAVVVDSDEAELAFWDF